MGLQQDLESRLAVWGRRAQELEASRPEQAEEDLHMVLAQYLSVAFGAIGALADAIVEIAGHVDSLESAPPDPKKSRPLRW